MKKAVVVGALVLTACGSREPPRGSGAIETTPSASADPMAAQVAKANPAVVPAPNGSILVVDPEQCKVELVQQGDIRWSHDFPACGGLLAAAIALDSMTYVRDDQGITSFDLGGGTRFRIPLPSASLPLPLFSPTVLADSRLAVATGPGKITIFDRDGKPAWSFSPPSEEVLVTAPSGMKTEGLTLLTTQAVYLLGAAGEIRFRATRQSKPR